MSQKTDDEVGQELDITLWTKQSYAWLKPDAVGPDALHDKWVTLSTSILS